MARIDKAIVKEKGLLERMCNNKLCENIAECSVTYRYVLCERHMDYGRFSVAPYPPLLPPYNLLGLPQQ